MSATTIINASLPSDIALSLATPDEGTNIQAGDVRTGEQTLLNNSKMVKNGSPTVTGAWTFSGADAAADAPAITATGSTTNGAGVVAAAGGGNAPGVIADGSGDREGLLAQGGATGPGAVLHGGISGGDALQATALAGGGNGVTAQGAPSGHGVVGTGGNLAGHGVVGNAGVTGNVGVKGVAVSGGAAVWAANGGYFCDTFTPGSSPPRNQMYKDKFIAAEGAVLTTKSTLGGSLTGGFINCAVTVDGTDALMVNVAFDTNMASGNYMVLYGEDDYTTSASGPEMKAQTVPGSKSAGGFSLRLRKNGAAVDFTADTGTLGFDFVVIGAQ